jgi:hypothetical protein
MARDTQLYSTLSKADANGLQMPLPTSGSEKSENSDIEALSDDFWEEFTLKKEVKDPFEYEDPS